MILFLSSRYHPSRRLLFASQQRCMQAVAAAATAADTTSSSAASRRVQQQQSKPKRQPPSPPSSSTPPRRQSLSPPSTTVRPPQPLQHPIPIRHSRKKLPLTCTDSVQRLELTQQVLETPVGSLFPYHPDKDTSEDAWSLAHETCEKVEYLVRGYAFTMPGTQWNRYLRKIKASDLPPSEDSLDNDGALATMNGLLERMWTEGHAYMTLRESRIEERAGGSTAASMLEAGDDDELDEGEDEDGVDLDTFLAERGVTDDGEEDDGDEFDDELKEVFNRVLGEENEKSMSIADTLDSVHAEFEKFGEGTDEEDEDEVVTSMSDFAFPGPTINMYDTILDAMACHASSISAESSNIRNGHLISPAHALHLVELAIGRHELDGGDHRNANLYTRPTLVTYNAPMRLASELPYDLSSKKASNLKSRDEALYLAIGCFDALSQSQLLERNSATYTYLIRNVAKYFPASRIKGNMAHGMFHHARLQGLVDGALIDAYKAANTPSNGDKFDEYIRHNFAGKALKLLPEKWRRHSSKRRNHPREAIY